MNTFQHQVQMLWGSPPVLDYPLHLILTLALVIINWLSVEGNHALVKYRGFISWTTTASAICTDSACAKICPCTLESLENFKNASVCTLKYNAFRPEVLLLST